jgi:hypothetical protein
VKSSLSVRSFATARETVLLTVPWLTPRTSATSASVMSSKNRSTTAARIRCGSRLIARCSASCISLVTVASATGWSGRSSVGYSSTLRRRHQEMWVFTMARRT